MPRGTPAAGAHTLGNTLEAELIRRQCRRSYAAYVQLSNPRFYMTHFHRYLCDKVQEFLEAPCHRAMDILLLSVPPRHGKSYTVTETLPSWVLGRDPAAHCIIASYESDFAEAFNRRNRDKFNMYAAQVWPDAKPNTSVQGVAMWETSEGGVCRAGGLRAGITGYGAELFIIDDPIKNKEQADSPTVLAKIQEEMGPSVQSRIHPGGKLIVIQTRWVEGDVIGWVQDHWSEYIWETINLPAEYDEEAAKAGPCPLGRKVGDSLMGAHLGDNEDEMPQAIMNTNSMVQSKKKLVIAADGARTWNALYQGRPTAEQGNLYDATWWRYYTRTDELLARADYIALSVDAAFKSTETSDYVCMQLWVLVGKDAYLWKLVNKRMDFIETVRYIKELNAQFPDIDELVIEDKANGSAIISTLQYEEGMPPIVAVTPVGGKLARAKATSNYVSTGACHLPLDLTTAEESDVESSDGLVNGKELTAVQRYVRQHAVFPFGKNDDMVDAQSQQLTRITKLLVGEVQVERRRHLRYTAWRPDQWQDYEAMDTDEQREAYVRRYGAPEEWAPDSYWDECPEPACS